MTNFEAYIEDLVKHARSITMDHLIKSWCFDGHCCDDCPVYEKCKDSFGTAVYDRKKVYGILREYFESEQTSTFD